MLTPQEMLPQKGLRRLRPKRFSKESPAKQTHGLALRFDFLMLDGVNYLAHGIRFFDRPYFLIGSAIPDLLSVVNRRSRVRRRTIEEHLSTLTGDDRELALGILQHLYDDQWFHGTPGFYAATGDLSRHFRDVLGPDDDWNCGFLGHLVTELLIDATLSQHHPGSLNQYYAVWQQIDPDYVQRVVGNLATEPAVDLSRFIGIFLQERFLEDYHDNGRLLFRLNQVMKRARLRELPDTVLPVLESGRGLIRDRLPDLLPPDLFEQVETGPGR